MSNFKLWNDPILYETNGKLAPTIANIPGLKTFFPFTGATASQVFSFSDTIGNLVLPSTVVSAIGTYGEITLFSAITALASGQMPIIPAGYGIVLQTTSRPTTTTGGITIGNNAVPAAGNNAYRCIGASATGVASCSNASSLVSTGVGAAIGNTTLRGAVTAFVPESATGIMWAMAEGDIGQVVTVQATAGDTTGFGNLPTPDLEINIATTAMPIQFGMFYFPVTDMPTTAELAAIARDQVTIAAYGGRGFSPILQGRG